MRVTGPLLKVLNTLLDNLGEPMYGLELLRTTKLKSGTLYPILDRLESAGWLTSKWEEIDPAAQGRPRRRFYTFTAVGRHEARQVLLEFATGGAFLWVR